jgi:hypothetical protein
LPIQGDFVAKRSEPDLSTADSEVAVDNAFELVAQAFCFPLESVTFRHLLNISISYLAAATVERADEVKIHHVF